MKSLLDRYIPSTAEFRPDTVSDLFALRLAQKLDDAVAVRHYVSLLDGQSESKLLVAYRRAIQAGKNRDLGRQFLLELNSIHGNGHHDRHSSLIAIRIERRTVAAAIFSGDHLEYADSRQLSSDRDRAVPPAKFERQAQALDREPQPLPTGPFRVIVADPPWQYDTSGNLPYPTMPIDEIKSMSVEDIAEDDAILWLWTTNAHLRVAFDVLNAWGFEYKSLLTWVKDRMGTGEWLRGQTEHCLLATRGKPVFLHGSQTTALQAARREHSRKPEEFYALVEATCPGSKLELFARHERDGWMVFGDQTALFKT